MHSRIPPRASAPGPRRRSLRSRASPSSRPPEPIAGRARSASEGRIPPRASAPGPRRRSLIYTLASVGPGTTTMLASLAGFAVVGATEADRGARSLRSQGSRASPSSGPPKPIAGRARCARRARGLRRRRGHRSRSRGALAALAGLAGFAVVVAAGADRGARSLRERGSNTPASEGPRLAPPGIGSHTVQQAPVFDGRRLVLRVRAQPVRGQGRAHLRSRSCTTSPSTSFWPDVADRQGP